MKKVMSEAQANFLRELSLQSADVLTKYAYRFFGYQLHMREIAEEAVQDTYLKAVEDIEPLMIHPNPIGWLKVSLRNILLTRPTHFLSLCVRPESPGTHLGDRLSSETA